MKPAKTFTDRVYDVTRRIPRGKTLTYAEVARRAGSPGASRAVGSILAKNFDPQIPCHRVIGSDGKMHGYNRGIDNKARLLREEGALKL
jgi:O-6-methylguanine DNA methyltransferase